MSPEHFEKLQRHLASAATEQGLDFTAGRTVLFLVRQEWATITDESALTIALGSQEDANKAERIAALKAELAELEGA